MKNFDEKKKRIESHSYFSMSNIVYSLTAPR